MLNRIRVVACVALILFAPFASATQTEPNEQARTEERRAQRQTQRSRAGRQSEPRVPRQSERRAAASELPRAAAQASPGRLGVEIDVADEGAVRLVAVPSDSPASAGGLRAGDVVLAFEGQVLDGPESLVAAVRGRSASSQVQLRIRRTIALELDSQKRTADGRIALGAYLTDDPERLVVARLAEGHPAASGGMLAGDSIVAIDGDEVRREADLAARMRSIDAARRVEVTLERDVKVRLGAATQPAAPELARPRATPQASVAEQRELLRQLEALRREIDVLREELQGLREQLEQRPAR